MSQMIRSVAAVLAAFVLFSTSPVSAATVALKASASYDRNSPLNSFTASGPPSFVALLDESERIVGTGPINIDVTFDVQFTEDSSPSFPNGLFPLFSNVVGTFQWASGLTGNVALNSGGIVSVGTGGFDVFFDPVSPLVFGTTTFSSISVELETLENPFSKSSVQERLDLFLAATPTSISPRIDIGGGSGGLVEFDVDVRSSLTVVPLPASGVLLIVALGLAGAALKRRG